MRGKVLLGWLSEAEAVRYLLENCVFDPPINEQQAKEMWAERKVAVDALGQRLPQKPPRLKMSGRERLIARNFLDFHRRKPGNVISDVVKVDPMALVIRQFDVTLDRCDEYAKCGAVAFIKRCLATARPAFQGLQLNHGPNCGNYTLPHPEFIYVFNDQVGGFVVVEGGPQVGVSEFADRMVLWTGYHRSVARASMVNPEHTDRVVFAALTTEGNSAFGAGSTNPTLRDLVLGDCPPVVSDFFDERFFMEVEMRKKRYELQVRARPVGINID
jgi:hypothetical protein